MKNQDTRVQMTKKLLKDALLEILKSKPITSVTVKELVDTAGINRGTFYLHYDTPMALLKDIENSFVQDNMGMFESFLAKGYDRSYLSLLFESVWKNQDVLRILLGPNGDPAFQNTLREIARARTVDEWNTEFPKYKREHLDFRFQRRAPNYYHVKYRTGREPQYLRECNVGSPQAYG